MTAPQATLRATLRGAAGCDLRLVQIALGRERGEPLRYLVNGRPIDPAQPVILDTRVPSLVRLELWRNEEPVAFTNPVRLLL